MNIVLFLGAGYSAPFGYPVMNQFTRYADSSSKLKPSEKELLRNIILEARKANSFLQSSPTNLEDILSFAIMGERIGLQNNRVGTSSSIIRRILQKIYTDVADTKTFWSQHDTFKSLLGYDEQWNHQLTVVTTNYDLNIECSLFRLGIPSDPSIEYNIVPGTHGKYRLYERGGIPLLKLHGSVNWYEMSKNQDILQVEDSLVQVHGPMSDDRSYYLPLVCTRNYNPVHAPFIIPPSYIKPEFTKHLREIWRRAANALQNAHIVVFVGYSFIFFCF